MVALGQRMRSMSMRSNLLAAAATGLVVAVVVGIVGILRMNVIADRADAIYRKSLVPLSAVQEIEQIIWHARWASLSGTTTDDAAKAKAYNDQAAELMDQATAGISGYGQLQVTAAEKTAMAQIQASWEQYLAYRQQAVALKKAGKTAEWNAFRVEKLNPTIAQAVGYIGDLKKTSQASAAAASAAAQRAAGNARTTITGTLLLGILLAGVIALLSARLLTRRLSSLAEMMSAMASGDLRARPADPGADEIGRMSRSAGEAVDHMRSAMQTLADASSGLAQRSEDMQGASRSLAGSVEQASGRIGSIDQAAEAVTAGVQAVAGGAEQMGAAIREIAVSASEAAKVASSAVDTAAEAEKLMTKLDASSAEVDSVVKTITAIAEQTNLLALNATIEAARAGETGKGFAVVAGEVKDLAQETAKATEEISRRIEAIQRDAKEAVDSISGIGQIIGTINDFQNTIASAVEQQSATTQGMTDDLARAAGGTADISTQLADVVQVTASTREAADATENAATDLSRISTQLQHVIATFRY
ncbi:methyl-accepting chemotaxis protein [Actinoplanes subtropicus]|uniref:methyl-accepting chemotaxis protein n=1 Tax=Actinoplanes subtropicus TaxID=543632 RepID=UPI0004C2B792|nr:methyl-accepting chemotaxis protein [Actinoplanes subtropicus]